MTMATAERRRWPWSLVYSGDWLPGDVCRIRPYPPFAGSVRALKTA